ncbi:MAG: HEAT repeat domain-containing protein [Rhodospirillales bacterium]
MDGGRISASLGAVPVVDVLTMVAQQTGATLSVRGELGNVRPQAFNRMPLAEALPRLAQPNGLILQFDETRGARRLLAIHAVAPGSTGGSSGGATRRITGQAAIMKLWNYEDGSELPSSEQRTGRLNKLAKQRKGGSTVVQSLVYVLSGDPDPAVRRTALGLLAGLPGDEARRAVLQTVVDVDPDMRVEALRALSATGEKPVSVLAQIVKGDTDANVRLAAIGMLDSRDGDLARAVLEGARGDADPQVREAAQQALRR